LHLVSSLELRELHYQRASFEFFLFFSVVVANLRASLHFDGAWSCDKLHQRVSFEFFEFFAFVVANPRTSLNLVVHDSPLPWSCASCTTSVQVLNSFNFFCFVVANLRASLYLVGAWSLDKLYQRAARRFCYQKKIISLGRCWKTYKSRLHSVELHGLHEVYKLFGSFLVPHRPCQASRGKS
jgi:hypothetical protein